MLLILFLSKGLQAQESIEYVAEHLLESPMNARALSYPLIPSDTDDSAIDLSLGYESFQGGIMQISGPMLTLSGFTPLSDRWGIIGSVFYDKYRIPTTTGDAIGELKLVDHPGFPESFNIFVTGVAGHGDYKGASVALAHIVGKWRWQAGVAFAQMNINQFDVTFNTTYLTPNTDGVFDYSGKYNINTIFGRVETKPLNLNTHFTLTPHVMIATNVPHVHFQERVAGPGYEFSSSSDAGSHIPDDYIGAGVRFEHKPSGISIDLGATVYMALFEPMLHKGISSPLFLTVSIPIK